jgi:2-oxoglutarate ferredoxin oxidoreductase subunit gamma
VSHHPAGSQTVLCDCQEVELGRTEVRIGGFGGQGVVLAGVLLGQAALNAGRYAVQTQSYGAEARGGAARSEVILSDEPVLYPEVVAPDTMVALSQAALDKYLSDLKPDGMLVLDADLVTDVPQDLTCTVRRGRFAHVAGEEMGRPIVANMVMLGFLQRTTGLLPASALRDAVAAGVPKGTEELNLQALAHGEAMGDAAAEG